VKDTAVMTEPMLHTALTPAVLRDVLQQAGYRVEEIRTADGSPCLRSATAGLGFEVRFANPVPGEDGATPLNAARFADASFQAAFQVHGELPLALVNHWNVSRRFARLNLLQNLLLLDMDILAIGGVTAGHLRAQTEIWDRLVSQLIVYLREELPKLAPRAEPAPQESAEPADQEPAPVVEPAPDAA
jgi:hypothetical protein